MRHLSIFFFIYLTAFFLSCTVKAQGITTVQPKSGAVFTTVASGTTTVSGTVTTAPSGTQTVNGTVTCTPSGTQAISGTVTCSPSGTQTVSVSNSPTVITSAANSSVVVQGSYGTVYTASVSFSTTARRLAVNASGICNNGGSARRNRLMFKTGATACYLGNVSSSSGGLLLNNSTEYNFELDGGDYFLYCSSANFIVVLEVCN